MKSLSQWLGTIVFVCGGIFVFGKSYSLPPGTKCTVPASADAAASLEAFAEWERADKANDCYGRVELAATRRISHVFRGTEVLVLDSGFRMGGDVFYRKVRVLSINEQQVNEENAALDRELTALGFNRDSAPVELRDMVESYANGSQLIGKAVWISEKSLKEGVRLKAQSHR